MRGVCVVCFENELIVGTVLHINQGIPIACRVEKYVLDTIPIGY